MFFAYLVEAGILERNPAAALKVRYPLGPEPAILTAEEQAKLLAAMEAASGPAARRDHVLFSVFAGTGLRLA